jgi:hypothetical protein
MAGTGYGLTKPEKPIGFLKLDISLHLKESFALTLLRNPWVYAAREPDVQLVCLRSLGCRRCINGSQRSCRMKKNSH